MLTKTITRNAYPILPSKQDNLQKSFLWLQMFTLMQNEKLGQIAFKERERKKNLKKSSDDLDRYNKLAIKKQKRPTKLPCLAHTKEAMQPIY